MQIFLSDIYILCDVIDLGVLDHNIFSDLNRLSVSSEVSFFEKMVVLFVWVIDLISAEPKRIETIFVLAGAFLRIERNGLRRLRSDQVCHRRLAITLLLRPLFLRFTHNLRLFQLLFIYDAFHFSKG